MADEQQQKDIQVVREFFDAWEAKDVERLLSYWADDAVFRIVFSRPPLDPEWDPPLTEGGDAIRAYWRKIMGIIDKADIKDMWIRAVVDEPGCVIATFRGEMRLTNGRAYKNDYINLFRVENGKIKLFHEHYNPLVVLESFQELDG